jgi:hypothetical protein
MNFAANESVVCHDNSVVIPDLFGIHIAGRHRCFNLCEEIIKFRLCLANAFKSHWHVFRIYIIGPVGIIPSVKISKLNFQAHVIHMA